MRCFLKLRLIAVTAIAVIIFFISMFLSVSKIYFQSLFHCLGNFFLICIRRKIFIENVIAYFHADGFQFYIRCVPVIILIIVAVSTSPFSSAASRSCFAIFISILKSSACSATISCDSTERKDNSIRF